MIRLGEKQQLEVVKKADFGLYLKEAGTEDDSILLPVREAPEDATIGSILEVFVYKDSEDRFVCTTLKPAITIGQFKMLKVAQVTKIGAFLEWGLMKDLFLPFKEQVGTVNEGESYLVGLYIDKSQRLCATMKITKLLSFEHELTEGMTTKGIIYNVHKEIGVFVAVEGKYQGLLPMKEVTKRYQVGSEITFKIGRVREDGRLDLTLREGGFEQMEVDEERLFNALTKNKGFISINDRSPKEVINKGLDMSKRAFKRALGRLMKAGKAEQTQDGTRLKS
jgi:predicted RNA-binding protein (virulence factor B family)